MENRTLRSLKSIKLQLGNGSAVVGECIGAECSGVGRECPRLLWRLGSLPHLAELCPF